MTPRAALEIERVLAECEHPYANHGYAFGQWCNVCGAIKFAADAEWKLPHWRDRLVLAERGQ